MLSISCPLEWCDTHLRHIHPAHLAAKFIFLRVSDAPATACMLVTDRAKGRDVERAGLPLLSASPAAGKAVDTVV